MKQELIKKYEKERDELSAKINSGTLSEYSHTVAVHTYNKIIEFIKDLEKL